MGTAMRIRTVLLPAALGAVWPFAIAALFAFSGYVTIPLIQTAHHLGLDASARLIVRAIDAALWSFIFGALFGIPLGLIARTKIAAAWMVFLVALLVVSLVDASRSHMGIGIVLVAWSIPETWLYVVAVLCFALYTAHLTVREAPGAAAP